MLVNTDLLSSPTQHWLRRHRAALQLPYSFPRVLVTLSPVKSCLKTNVLQGIAASYPLRKAAVYKPQPS